MKRLILFFLLVTILSFSAPKNAFAKEKAAGTSAVLVSNIEITQEDTRVKTLRKYLEKYNSPLAPYAKTFVADADKYDLDWKFVAAISGLESTFGQQIPSGSYNGWGWGIYGTNTIYFTSWENGIDTVSEGLRTRYMDGWGAKDIWQIGRMYAASPTWAVRVQNFMNQIESYRLRNPADMLSISI